MKNLNISYFIFSFVLIVNCTSTIASASAASIIISPTKDVTIKAEIIESISIKSLWHSLKQFSYTSDSGARITYWATSAENMVTDKDWVSPGVLIAGLGDIDEKPIAVRIWTKKSDQLLKEKSLSVTESGNDAIALFGDSHGTVSLQISIRPTGEVFLDNILIGKID